MGLILIFLNAALMASSIGWRGSLSPTERAWISKSWIRTQPDLREQSHRKGPKIGVTQNTNSFSCGNRSCNQNSTKNRKIWGFLHGRTWDMTLKRVQQNSMKFSSKKISTITNLRVPLGLLSCSTLLQQNHLHKDYFLSHGFNK